jgi:uncharacterized protein YndB with AHSA1/START domain
MSQFILLTNWKIAAPVSAVWEALSHPEDWPRWWPYVAEVTKLADGDDNDLGARHRFVWRTRLPYTLAFDTETVALEKHKVLVARAKGDVNGTGTWRLSENGNGTEVSYEWRVDLASGWKRQLAPLAAPVFRWNHEGVMRAGGEGLSGYLGRPRQT